MIKPYGVGEWDGYPSVSVPKDRQPLSKEEEERIGAELRENVRKIAQVRKDPLHRKTDENRKIG